MTARLHTLRESLKKRAAALTDPRRRFNCQDQNRRSWDERAEAAVNLLSSLLENREASGAIQVADLGCGNERLERILNLRFSRPFVYSGYDLHPQSDDVERLDVERGLPAREFDVVFCLGLIEYLPNPELFLRRLRRMCPLAIVSYVVAGAEGSLQPAERRRRGWRSDYAAPELERMFEQSGFVTQASASVHDGLTALWLIADPEPPHLGR